MNGKSVAWERVMWAQVTNLIKNDIFKIVKHRGQKVAGSRIVLTKKYELISAVDKFKTKIIAVRRMEVPLSTLKLIL